MTNHLKKKSKSIKSKSKKQKMHYMVGCSTKTRKINKNNKNNKKKRNNKYLGGSPFFAYPDNNIERVTNPHLAYTGGSNIPLNPNGEYPDLPSVALYRRVQSRINFA